MFHFKNMQIRVQKQKNKITKRNESCTFLVHLNLNCWQWDEGHVMYSWYGYVILNVLPALRAAGGKKFLWRSSYHVPSLFTFLVCLSFADFVLFHKTQARQLMAVSGWLCGVLSCVIRKCKEIEESPSGRIKRTSICVYLLQDKIWTSGGFRGCRSLEMEFVYNCHNTVANAIRRLRSEAGNLMAKVVLKWESHTASWTDHFFLKYCFLCPKNTAFLPAYNCVLPVAVSPLDYNCDCSMICVYELLPLLPCLLWLLQRRGFQADEKKLCQRKL